MASGYSVLAQLRDGEGNATGSRVMIPQDVTPEQLNLMLQQYLDEETMARHRYAYFVNDREICTSLVDDLRDSGLVENGQICGEQTLDIVYHPRAPFTIRTISRSSSAMTGHSEAVLVVAFSPNGKYLVSGSGDSTIRFWDLSTETLMSTGTAHKGWVQCLVWSPDSQWVASGSMDSTVQIWNGRTGTPFGRALAGHQRWVTCLAWEPLHVSKSHCLVASGSKDGTVKIWDPVLSRCLCTLSRHRLAVTCVRWGGERYLYSGSRDGSVCVWTSEGRLVRSLDGHGHWVNTMSLSTDSAVQNGGFDPLEPVVSVERQRERAREQYESVGGERLVTGSDDFTLILWTSPFNNEAVSHRLTGHQGVVSQVRFSPDGRLVASASFDKSVRLWNGVTGKEVAVFRGHVGAVYQIAWSLDSRMVVSGSKDRTLKVWEVGQKKMRSNLPGHGDEVYAVDWSPDGSRVASGGRDKTLRIWRS